MAKAKAKTKQQEDFRSELAFHEREWRLQRIGWAFIALVPLLALTGLFGSGPLSDVQVSVDGVGTLHYERFVRRGAHTVVTIEPSARGGSGQRVPVALASDYLEGFELEQITPEPVSTQLVAGRVIFEFERRGTAAAIAFHLQPERIGRHRTQVVVDSGPPLVMRQFTYP